MQFIGESKALIWETKNLNGLFIIRCNH